MTKIKHIVLEVAGKEVKLTPAEARTLYNELHMMFGQQQTHWQWYQPTTWPTITPTWPTTYPVITSVSYADGDVQ